MKLFPLQGAGQLRQHSRCVAQAVGSAPKEIP